MSLDYLKVRTDSVRNRISHAFKEPGNLVGLATAVGLSAAFLNPIPLIAALVGEAAYLLFVPDTKWFLDRLDKKFDQEVIDHREQVKKRVMPKLPEETQQRVDWLERQRIQIEKQAPVQDKWFKQALRKLDLLLEKYLEFGEKQSDFKSYVAGLVMEIGPELSRELANKLPDHIRLAVRKGPVEIPGSFILDGEALAMISVVGEHYRKEQIEIDARIAAEQIPANRDILSKRKNVMERRASFVERLTSTLTNIHNQMQLIYDTFGLVNDEIRARSPEQVLADIDEVVMQATSLTDAIDELTPASQVVGGAMMQ